MTHSNKKILYVITPNLPLNDYKKRLKRLLPHGIDFLQYRRKNVSTEEALEELYQIKMLCDVFQVPLIVNDSIELATQSGAYGVHLGQEDCAVLNNPSLDISSLSFGLTTKTVTQALKAQSLGASYMGVGAFFPSNTKSNALPISMDMVKNIKNAVKLPLYAIGGITPFNLTPELVSLVDGVCFSDIIFNQSDPERVIQDFKLRLNVL